MRQRHVRSQKDEKRPRINEQIRSAEVLLVGDDGKTERLPVADALARAKELELDLIEVSPKAQPPVVKIDNFGHYLYQLQKKERRQKVKSKQTEVKTLRFGFRTERHDLERLMDRAREFMKERHLVKFVVRLRGRELTNIDYAVQKMKSVVAALQDSAEVEQELKRQGNQFLVVLRAKR